MTQKTNPPVYRNSAAHGDLYCCFPRYTYPASGIQREAPEIFGNLEGKVIADIGCGFGSAVIALFKERVGRRATFVHIDSDPRVFDAARAREVLEEHAKELYDRSGDQTIVADVISVPLPSSSVDIIHYHYMFSDNPELSQPQALAEMDRLLRPGGYLIGGGSGPLSFWDFFVLCSYTEERANQRKKELEKSGYGALLRYRPIIFHGEKELPLGPRIFKKLR